MTHEHDQKLRELAEQTRAALDLFPWPDDSPYSEEGLQVRVVGTQLRTPQQLAAEQDLRRLRAALRNLLVVIDGYLPPT
jgi:hypothetical protein